MKKLLGKIVNDFSRLLNLSFPMAKSNLKDVNFWIGVHRLAAYGGTSLDKEELKLLLRKYKT